MPFARAEAGARPALAALWSQVHPVFMLPPLATASFGALLAGTVDIRLAVLHLGAIFFAVYTAHIKDGYVDFHVRGEDEDHPLSIRGCRQALLAAGAGAWGCLLGLALLGPPLAAVLTATTWVIGFLHAPQLDTNPVTTTLGYPVGIGIALVSGFMVQVGTLELLPLVLGGVLIVLLAGVKIIDDAQDYSYDRTIAKQTVAVLLGKRAAHKLAYAVMTCALAGVVVATALGIFPPASLLGAAAFGGIAGIARRADPEIATMLLIRGAYVFLAVLLWAVWFRPLE